MKLVVDRDLCEANAVCVRIAPEVFRVGEDDQMTILVERPAEALRAKVMEAIRRCPRGALKIEDAGE